MALEKEIVFSLRLPPQLRRSIKTVAARGGLTWLDWIRASFVVAVHTPGFDPDPDPGIEGSTVTPIRVTPRLKDFMDRAARKSGAQTQAWARGALSWAIREGLFAPGGPHGRSKRKSAD